MANTLRRPLGAKVFWFFFSKKNRFMFWMVQMTVNTHPARLMPFEALLAGLKRAVAAGLVCRRWSAGLSLYVYTPRCVYEDAWDEFTLLARGLILDEAAGAVVATPFPKFFNVGERHGAVPDLKFEAFEKLDGSLIICFWHDGKWRAATKGRLPPSRRCGRRRCWMARS
jgi:RNA ligase